MSEGAPKLHWPEYGAELAGTAFLVFAGLSAVVFDFGRRSPVAALIPNQSWRLLHASLSQRVSARLRARPTPQRQATRHQARRTRPAAQAHAAVQATGT